MDLGEGLWVAGIILFLGLCDGSMVFCSVIIYVMFYTFLHFYVFGLVRPFKKHSELLANAIQY